MKLCAYRSHRFRRASALISTALVRPFRIELLQLGVALLNTTRPMSTATSIHNANVSSSSTLGENTNGPNSDSTSSAQETTSMGGKEVQFYEEFTICEEDIHYQLLHEAHVKHGVLLNVPPQLPPNGTPPEVPEVRLPTAQIERMREMKLAYEPTHNPPPLHTTGTRQLVIDQSISTLPHFALDKSKTTTSTTLESVSTTTSVSKSGKSEKGLSSTTLVVRRLAPDPTTRFHCTACGKAFRLEFSAEHHVKLSHPNDSKASVAAGPGAGEIIEEAETINVAAVEAKKSLSKTSPSSTIGSPSSAGHIGMSSTMPYNRATLTLPSEDLVDELLKDVWDSVAEAREDVPKNKSPNAYVTFANTVQGKADRRQEMAAQAMPTARATPENAAPGIKKPGALSGGAMIAKSRTGHFQPIKELVKKYPNPFGDSPNAALQELENEPMNPFIPEEELAIQIAVSREKNDTYSESAQKQETSTGSTSEVEKLKEKIRATRPNLSQAAALRRFVCPLCTSNAPVSFRILDALLDHIDQVHGGEDTLTETQLKDLYTIQRRSSLYPIKSDEGETLHSGVDEVNGGNNAKDSSSGSAGNNNKGWTREEIKTLLPENVRDAAPPPAVEQKGLSVHVRASSNTVLIGRIADVQHGFLGSTSITQYVIEVNGEEAKNAEDTLEKELIVVRCMGNNFPAALLKDQVKLGSTVLVQGTLRMNRHIDDASKRMHAYPFVQVVPPLGCVKVL